MFALTLGATDKFTRRPPELRPEALRSSTFESKKVVTVNTKTSEALRRDMTDPTPPVRERFFRLWRAAAPRVELAPGDAVLYRGRELAHFREPGPARTRLRQLVLAWRAVDALACLGGV